MSILKPYSYSFRPAYGSSDMLIEFNRGASKESFMEDLAEELKPMNAKVESNLDAWMNDEVWIYFNSDEGKFMLTKDIWGFVFIMSDSSQGAIYAIHEVLQKSDKFESDKVDFEQYRTDKTKGKEIGGDEPPHKG